VFAGTGKAHYFDICLGMIGQLYSEVPFHVLQVTRINRTVPLHDGCDKKGNPMASWALDAIIELLQRYYHKMNFDNTLEQWKLHSGNFALTAKSIKFVKVEYSRLSDSDNSDAKYVDLKDDYHNGRDAGYCKKGMKVPARILERQLISELITLSGATREQSGRKYNRELFWESFKECKTELQPASLNERTARWQMFKKRRRAGLVGYHGRAPQ
jgi:hypothetical protein